jgi:putative ABC transport system permease protein
MLRLTAGRYPQGPDEIAVTDRVAKTFNLHLGGIWPASRSTDARCGTSR